MPLDQEPLGGLAAPCVGVGERPDKLRGRCRAQSGLGPTLESFRHDLVDPPAVLAARQVEVPLDRIGDRGGMLDRLAVHVQDGERAVRRVREVHRPEPVVARGQEFDTRIGPGRLEDRAVLGERLAVDQVAADVADEGVAVVLRRVGGAPVDRDARGRREEAGRDQLRRRQSLHHVRVGRSLAGPDDSPGLGRADPEDRPRAAFDRDVGQHGPRRVERVPVHGLGGKHDLPDVVAVIADEPVAPVVEAMAELAAARDRLEVRPVGPEAEVAAAEGHGLRVGLGQVADLAAIAPARPVDPAVGAPDQAVHEPLHVLGAEAGEELAPDVGHAVAVEVDGK